MPSLLLLYYIYLCCVFETQYYRLQWWQFDVTLPIYGNFQVLFLDMGVVLPQLGWSH